MRTIQADHPDHLTTPTNWPPQPPWSPWPPDHQGHQDQLDHFGFPNPQQQFAKFASILSWVCKQVFSNDNLQKKSPERHIAKKLSWTRQQKKFSRPPICKKDVRNSLINLTSLLFCLITLEYWLVIQSCQRSLWYNPTTSNHSFPRAGESEISLGAKKEKVFVQTDFKFTKYFWFAEKIVLFFEITRCTLLLKKTTAVDSISLFVVGALANCNQERPGLRLISLLNSLLCWNFWEVLKFQSFDYLNSTSYIVLLPRTFTQPQQPRNIVRCESNFFSLSDWALPVQEEKI